MSRGTSSKILDEIKRIEDVPGFVYLIRNKDLYKIGITISMKRRVKGYTAVSAISEAFKILQTGVVDQHQREQIEAIKAQLTALEDGQTIDV